MSDRSPESERPPEPEKRPERERYRDSRHYDEKEEEKREKDEEKQSEKEHGEKGRRDPVRLYTWAAVLIWAGIAALIDTSNLVTATWWDGWWVFVTGVGIILLVAAAFRMRPEYRRPAAGTIILGIICLVLGLSKIIARGWDTFWPIILIVIGIVLVVRHRR